MIFRKANPNDLKNMNELWNEVVKEEYFLKPMTYEEFSDKLLTNPDFDYDSVTVVYENEKLIAFSIGYLRKKYIDNPDVAGIVNMIMVKKEYRKQGIGSKLLKDLETYFKEHGRNKIAAAYFLPSCYSWYIPNTNNHDHPCAPGIRLNSNEYFFLLHRGYETYAYQDAFHLDLSDYELSDSVNKILEENGIKLRVDLENGQKTGYFLDQKTNRAALDKYVKDKRVLDCFSHTGGFALNAINFGAKFATAVDISEKACNDILENAKLNNFENKIDIKCCDVFDFLRDENNKNKYDVIVLDPPAFTKSKDTVEKAYKGYKEINMSALKLLNENGILITFSCSQHMTPALFIKMLTDASNDVNKVVQMVDFRIQSPDHPTRLGSDDSLYLKCVVLRVL